MGCLRRDADLVRVIDGDGDGQIIAQGPPEKIAKSKTSRTAPFLKIVLRL